MFYFAKVHAGGVGNRLRRYTDGTAGMVQHAPELPTGSWAVPVVMIEIDL